MKEKLLYEYFKILCFDDYPEFLKPYLEVLELKRLQYIGQFCGCDYSIYNPLFFYSRYDHSVATALMTWHFTHDKIQTLCALFHDVGTPCFSHCIDYLYKDYEKQGSSEKNAYYVISNSAEIRSLLLKDNISLELLQFPEKYPIVENEKPKICVDRLDGVLHTVFIWIHTHNLEEIKKVYQDMTILQNEDGLPELGFMHQDIAELFFEMCQKYSMELQSNEDKYVMQFTADCVKKLVDNGHLIIEELYEKKESDIVTLFEQYIPTWTTFTNTSCISRSDQEPSGYNVSLNVKKRYVLPLCKNNDVATRLTNLSIQCSDMLKTYLSFSDSRYAYIPEIVSVECDASKKITQSTL